MAYYLEFDGVDDYVTFTDILEPATTFILELEFAYASNTSGNTVHVITSPTTVSNGQGAFRFEIDTSNNVKVLFTLGGNGRVINTLTPWNDAPPKTIKVTWDSTTNTVITLLDNVQQASNTGYTTFDFGVLAGISLSSYGFANAAEIDLYNFSVTSDSDIRNYDPSASNGVGLVLKDTVGANDGTLVNFPTDNSQWVFYGGGGGLTIITSPIVSGEVVGSPTFTTGTVLIDPVAIATAESVGNPTIAFGVTVLNPTAIASVELVGEPVVVPLGVVLQPVEIVTEEVVGTPVVVTGLVFLIPDSISTEEAVGEPFVDTLLKQIFPTEILSLEDVGRPSVFGGDSIIIPIPSRQTWNAVAKYLRGLVFKGADNDVIMAWMRSEGFEEAYNDNWDDYLLGQGYLTGALADRYAQWRQGVSGDDPWILSEGTWNDNKIWRDNEFWRDS